MFKQMLDVEAEAIAGPKGVALGVAEAQRGFRRVKGHRQMGILLAPRRPKNGVAEETKVA